MTVPDLGARSGTGPEETPGDVRESKGRCRRQFLEQFYGDRDEGRLRALHEYLRLFAVSPQDVLDIVGEYQALVDDGHVRAVVPGGTALLEQEESPGQIGPYRLLRLLGQGGFGDVHLALDTRLGREVALKILRHAGPAGPEVLERFRREAQITARLEHSGICPVYETGTVGHVPYIAMRYVEGETLARLLARARTSRGAPDFNLLVPMPGSDTGTEPGVRPGVPPRALSGPTTRADVTRVVALIGKAARALHAAHEAGVIHRDVKPGNIIVRPDGEPVILDFGLARELETEEATLTQSGALLGTPQYLSPEQLAARRVPLDRRTDIYSLGVTLYECLTLECPFQAPTRAALYMAILTKAPIDPRKLNRSIPKDLQVVVETAIEKDLDRRYASAEALAEDLEAVIEGRPIRARPAGTIGRLVRWSKREPAKAALLGVIVVALPTIAALVTSHVKDQPQVEAARRARFEQVKDEILADASFEVTEGDARRAAALFGQVLEMDGSSPEAAGGLVLASLNLGDPAEALRLLARHRPVLGEGAAARLLRADTLGALGRKEEAAAEALALPAPRGVFEHHLLALKEVQNGEAGDRSAFGRALRHATTAVLLSPTPRLSLFGLRATAAGHARDRDASVETAAALKSHWSDVAVAQFWCGFTLNLTDDPSLIEDAIASYREAIRLRPDYDAAYTNLGNALLKKGRLDEAISASREAIRLMPGRAEAHNTLGAAFGNKDLRADAIAAFLEAIRLKPAFAGAHNNLGLALRKQGRIDDALTAFREAIRLRQDDAEFHDNLGTVLHDKGRFGDAIAAFRVAIRLKPEMPEAHCNLGNSLNGMGLHDEAMAACREAIRLKADNPEAHINLGTALNKKGLVDDAIAAYREAIHLRADDSVAYTGLGDALMNKGLLDEAIAAFREAVRRSPRGYEAYSALGFALVTKGLLDEAISSCREAIHLEPDCAEAHCNLGFAFRELTHYRESLAEFRHGHELGSGQPAWSHPSGEWVAEAERLVSAEAELEARLVVHLAAGTKPEGARELVLLARVALDQGRGELAAHWYRTAFEEAPDLAERITEGFRRRGARAAVSASCAGADVAPDADDAARTAWRLQALAWLEDEVSDIRDAWQEDRIDARRVRMALVPLKHFPDLAPVRHREALADLPDSERERWNLLWADVESLILALEAGDR